MPDIASTIDQIAAQLRTDGPQSSSTVLERLRANGTSAETASTAIAAGSQSGAFSVDGRFRLTVGDVSA